MSYLLLPHVCPTRLKQKTQGRSQAAGPAPQHHPGLASLHLVGAAAARGPGRLPGRAAPASSPRRPGPRADSLPRHEEVSGGTGVSGSWSLPPRAWDHGPEDPLSLGDKGRLRACVCPGAQFPFGTAFQANRSACSVRSYFPYSALRTFDRSPLYAHLSPAFFFFLNIDSSPFLHLCAPGIAV